MKPRTKARSVALQVLYEYDQSKHQVGFILTNRMEENPLDDNLVSFSQKIVSGVFPIILNIDEQISKYAPEWPIDQVAIIDRNILRIALWEMIFDSGTPVKVVINEAIELAKLYGSDSTPRFVNGVLGSLVDNLNEIKQNLIKVSPQ
jgi:N utilization substance protein B